MIRYLVNCKKCGEKPVVLKLVGQHYSVRCSICGQEITDSVDSMAVARWNRDNRLDKTDGIRKEGFKALCKACPNQKSCQEGNLFKDGRCYYKGNVDG